MKISIPYINFTAVPVDHENDIAEMYTAYISQVDAIEKYNHHDGKYKLVFTLEERVDAKELEEVQEALEGNCAFVIPAITKWDIKEYANLNSIYAFPCSTWHEVYSVASMGFNEVHVAPSMTMAMDALKRAVDDTGIKIRVTADRAQTDSMLDDKTPKSFWIRPEALHLYEDVIDTVELCRVEALPFYVKGNSPKNLDNLIDGLPAFTANANYRAIHDNTRLKCGMMCKTGKDCNICR